MEAAPCYTLENVCHPPVGVLLRSAVVKGSCLRASDTLAVDTGGLGLPWVKQGCLILVASADSHVAVTSGSEMDQGIDGLTASFSWNWESYRSQA